MTIDTPDKRKLFYFLHPLYDYACAKLIRTVFAKENHLIFPENIAYEDQLWGNLVHAYAARVYILELPLYHYYKNPNSIVHQRNSFQSLDLLTVHSKTKEQLISRNMDTLLADEYDFLLLFNCYLSFFKLLVYRFDTPDYSQYLLAREFIQSTLFHDYHSNPYVTRDTLTEVQMLLLTILDQPLSKAEFYDLVNAVKAGSLLDRD